MNLLLAVKLDLVRHFVMMILMALAPYFHGEILNSYLLLSLNSIIVHCFHVLCTELKYKDFYGMTLMK